MGIVDRIQTKVKEKGTNIKNLEKEIGIGNGTIRRWDERSPQCDKLTLVANYLQVSMDWLVYGKELSEINEMEKELLQYFRQLPEKEQIRELGRLEAKAEQFQELEKEKLSTYRIG